MHTDFPPLTTLTVPMNWQENCPKCENILSFKRNYAVCDFDYLNLQTCQRHQSGSNYLPDVQKFTEIFQKLKVKLCFTWRISSVVFSFAACYDDVTVHMNVTESRLFNLQSK